MSKERAYLKLETELMEKVDILAEINGLNRTAFITSLLTKEVRENKKLIEEFIFEKEKDLSKTHEKLMLKENW